MHELISIAAFLKRNIRKLRADKSPRGRENLLMWLAWHSSRFNACAVADEKGKIIGVGVARAIVDPLDSRIPYKSDDLNGKILFVEQVSAKTNDAFLSLLKYVQQRWKNCDRIMFYRAKSGSKNKVYDMNEFMKKAFL